MNGLEWPFRMNGPKRGSSLPRSKPGSSRSSRSRRSSTWARRARAHYKAGNRTSQTTTKTTEKSRTRGPFWPRFGRTRLPRLTGGPGRGSTRVPSSGICSDHACEASNLKMFKVKIFNLCGSHGLVVMGGDSFSEGRGFKSWHRILDGYFFTFTCCKNCIVCLKRRKYMKKRLGMGHFKKSVNLVLFGLC